ncbi:MAG: hypothetical protein JWQ27_2756 [Ferruginibacter sp.]|nr:hypothetical protein [Ferruginibacter sp.]
MKKLFVLAALTVASFAVNAQSPVKLSLGVDGQLPIGDFSDIYSFGIGGSLQADYNVDPELALTLSAGYLNFSGKTVNNFKYPSFGMVPVLAGIKYYFAPQVYGSAQLGLSFGTDKGDGSNFTYAPGIGYKFSNNVDALLKYTGMSVKGSSNSSFNTIGLRLAYTF